MTTYEINSIEKNRLDLLLRKELPKLLSIEISNSKIRRLIMAGCVVIDSRQVKVPSFTVFEKTKIFVSIDKEKLLFEKKVDDISFELSKDSVLFEDDYLIFVHKPTKFPTEKTIVQERDNLHDAVVRYLWKKNPSLRNPPYVGIMHRLDRETSGVILFTKTRQVNKAIFDMFDSSKLEEVSKNSFGNSKKDEQSVKNLCNVEGNRRKIEKTYIAVVKDSPLVKNSFIVKNYLSRITSKSSGCKWGSVKKTDALFAVTEFKVRKREKGLCYIECHPITGRTHQIRVHLSESGFPILGDQLYGGPKSQRLMLHAESLKIIHPISNEKLEIKACDSMFII